MRQIFLVLLAVFGAMQLIQVDHTNPPSSPKNIAPQAAQKALERSCYDCHSDHTRWPWYSYVAPLSWSVAQDVSNGRRALNFSHWDELNASEKIRLKESIEVKIPYAMPPSIYTQWHKDAHLSLEDVRSIREWTHQL